MKKAKNAVMTSEIQHYIEYLASCWHEAGIEPGDVLLVHSTVSRVVRRARKEGIDLRPEHILESFIRSVGSEGTLLFPTFRIEVSHPVHFDILNTPSKMGALTEAARLHPDAVRTEHPLLSMAVLGRYKMEFKNCRDYTGIGKDSPFGLLHRLSGKIAVLSLPENESMSFYHHVENVFGVDHRWTIDFNTVFVDENGAVETRKHGFYARKRDQGVITNVEPMGRLLWEKGLYHGEAYNCGNGIRVVRAQDVFEETARIIKNGACEGHLFDFRSTAGTRAENS